MSGEKFNLESVRDFMIQNGGKITNHQLVTRFRQFLNDPEQRAINREKFKDFVNTLATIKFDENNEKILVLKKKFRTDDNSTLDSSTASTASRTSDDIKYDSVRAQSEPPIKHSSDTKQVHEDAPDGASLSRATCKSEGTIAKATNDGVSAVSKMGSSSVGSVSTTSLTSETSVFEDEGNVSVLSVKERAKHLNRMESESEVLNVSRNNARNLSKSSRDSHDDDSQSSYVALEPEEKEWLVTVSSAEYHPIAKMLSKNASLAKIKDFTNTGLHWAAKNGKTEVVKLIAPKPGVNVNHRSGYTPLHVAAMHGHEDIIELLVSTYKADSNIRDYSGKKAKQYLKNSASTRAQQLLLSRKLSGSQGPTSMRVMDNGFLRSSSFRKSNRARSTAINSLIQASGTVGKNQELLRSSWSGSAEYINKPRKPGNTPPGSAGTSPRELRREFRTFSSRNVFTP